MANMKKLTELEEQLVKALTKVVDIESKQFEILGMTNIEAVQCSLSSVICSLLDEVHTTHKMKSHDVWQVLIDVAEMLKITGMDCLKEGEKKC